MSDPTSGSASSNSSNHPNNAANQMHTFLTQLGQYASQQQAMLQHQLSVAQQQQLAQQPFVIMPTLLPAILPQLSLPQGIEPCTLPAQNETQQLQQQLQPQQQQQPQQGRPPAGSPSEMLFQRKRQLNEREEFYLFVKIVFRLLESNARVRTLAKQIVAKCTRLNRSGDVNYSPLIPAIERRLRPVVGELSWTLAKDELNKRTTQQNSFGDGAVGSIIATPV